MNIEEFKANGLRLGGARPSLFEVSIPGGWPQSGLADRKLNFLAKAASIPPSVVESIDVPYFGRKIKVLGDRVFPNWSITVMNEENFTIRNGFMNWHEMMNSKVPNLLNNPDGDIESYKRDIFVTQYGKSGQVLFECKLVGAFPVTVDAIQTDWDMVNQIEMFDVEFAYDYWIGGEAITSGRAQVDTNYLPTNTDA
jgi:hypothetical protein